MTQINKKVLADMPGVERRETLIQMIEQAKREEKPLDLSFAHLDGTDLSGLDLSGANLDMANLSYTLAVGTIFREASMKFVYAINSDFYKADLTDANCLASNFQGTAFPDAVLAGADFRAADLRDINPTRVVGEALYGCKISTYYREEITDWQYTPSGWVKISE